MATKAFEPTKAQKNAIEASGGAITVSAAAGSGKTRVLVQRVIRHLTEEAVPADRLLILTFTNTAADEMRTRISRAIDELISGDPKNDFYRRQQLLLGSADICTIDSFCSKMVRENFYRLGISRDYRIGSETELHELRRRIMSDIIEKFYELPEGDPESSDYRSAMEYYDSFSVLSQLLTDTKLDNDLEDRLLAAYDKYSAHAFPDKWMDGCIRQYSPETDINESKAAQYLIGKLKIYAVKLREIFDKALEYRSDIMLANEKKKTKSCETVLDAYDSYEYFLESLEEQYSEDEPDITAVARISGEFEKITIRLGASKNIELKAGAALLNEFADTVVEKIKPYALFTDEEYKAANKKSLPVILCLQKLLSEFDSRFFEAKTEKGILDFHDLERLMLQLLYEKNDSGDYVRTDYAKELSECYDEIMVDEYQDTNDIQESIFKAISRDESNLFVVGDIKQSIYRFRDAQPGLFKRRCEKSRLYDEQSPSFPALIVLDKNFRSRSGIIDSVNYVFSLLMSEDAGDIEYDETQRLTAGAQYPEKDDERPDTEVHFVQYSNGSTDEGSEENDDGEGPVDNANTAEAKYCAGLIRKMVAEGTQVTDAGVLRPARYSDFCILLRAVRNKAHIYSEQLKKAGIEACTDTEFDLLQRYEIRAAVSYLKILNNPLSDVDIAASILCPVFGFTPDEAAELKDQKPKRYYKKLISKAADDDELGRKCKAFLNDIRYFRTYAVTAGCDKLLMEVFEKTGFSCAVMAMNDGGQRVQNLRRLVNFAADFEKNNGGGLTGFIRHIRYLEDSGSGIKVSDNVPDNAVRIMTIHHSKGLEFPICILAGTKTSKIPFQEKINFHPEFGIGLRVLEQERFLQYNSLQYTAIHSANEEEEKSEQMRVLYVAMTRAKEKLIILSTMKSGGGEEEIDSKYVKYLNSLSEKCSLDKDGKFLPYEVMSRKNYSDWIMMSLLVSSSMEKLREDAGIDGESMNTVTAPEILYEYCPVIGADHVAAEKKHTGTISAQLLEKLGMIFDRNEKTDISTLIPSKVSASMLAHKGISSEFVASVKPAFIRKGKVSPTQRGLAAHEFLQYADFKALDEEIRSTGGFENERRRIIESGYMLKEQTDIIEDKSILAFAGSELFKRALSCVKIYREYRFTVSIPAGMTIIGDEKLAEDVKMQAGGLTSVLQGAVDCMLEEEDGIVIIDYKTDHVKDLSELAGMYGTQLRLYKEAMEKLFDKPVKACYIYSLYCGTDVEIK